MGQVGTSGEIPKILLKGVKNGHFSIKHGKISTGTQLLEYFSNSKTRLTIKMKVVPCTKNIP